MDLTRRQLIIKYYHVGSEAPRSLGELLGFSFAYISAGMQFTDFLLQPVYYSRSGTFSQSGKFD